MRAHISYADSRGRLSLHEHRGCAVFNDYGFLISFPIFTIANVSPFPSGAI
jgi:hypothetical protein